MPKASLRQPGASGTRVLAHSLLIFTDRETKARSKEEADVLWQKTDLSPESTSEKMHLPNSPKKKKKNGGREGAYAPYKGGKRDTLSLHLSQKRPCHSRAAPEADITPHTLGAA